MITCQILSRKRFLEFCTSVFTTSTDGKRFSGDFYYKHPRLPLIFEKVISSPMLLVSWSFICSHKLTMN